jgi:hypothetical protein
MRRRITNKKARCQKNLEKEEKYHVFEGMKNGQNGAGWEGPRLPVFFIASQDLGGALLPQPALKPAACKAQTK